MCGIVGFSTPRGVVPADRRVRWQGVLERMVRSLRHRGPDALRAVLLDGMALGHARLAVVDLEGGQQPMRDPETGVTVVFNGEIFNHLELRERYASYTFRTRSDTEAILAGFVSEGISCVERFVGQFAFALWDPRDATLWLARDRVGIRPLFYTLAEDGIAFASEAKALFAGGACPSTLDEIGIKQTLQLWAPVVPRTNFKHVRCLPPGSIARVRDGRFTTRSYWSVDLSDANVRSPRSEMESVEELDSLLLDAVRLRLRADVPVAAYLSGGLDSSLICGMSQKELGGTLSTFSVAFQHANYDERSYQTQVAEMLSTRHSAVEIDESSIGQLLPSVVLHTEQVLVRSAPAPFLRLSRLVREHQIKVVLTGEGADEIFLGYDIFKETKARQFWARDPNSVWRPLILKRLYPYLDVSRQSTAFLRQVFGAGLANPTGLGFSHLVRWNNTGRIARFFSPEFREATAEENPVDTVLASVPERVATWRPLARAQFLEMQTLLSNYLLSAQGDRMLMGNSVEGRFPFLDHRVIEFAARLPDRLKLRHLNEKYLLKLAARDWVPAAILEREKFPYRAPIAGALTSTKGPSWLKDCLSREEVARVGIFDPHKASKLVEKLEKNPHDVSEADNMALVAISTTQLLATLFKDSEVRARALDSEASGQRVEVLAS